jgi:hypothetical protein
MTDRELLEDAAKAAGIKALRDPDGMLRDCTGLLPENNIFSAPYWNPLTDDGDALRLAVKLGITIMFDCSSVWCEQYGVLENHNGDPCAATRRAIGRAAAEIGKYMP